MQDSALDGVRVIDFGWSWAAPHGTMLLSDMGAQIIKLESARRIDVLRWSGSFPGGIRGYNRCGWNNDTNRGKISSTLDFTKPRAVELAKKLIKIADVVVENFSPHVMKNFGLDYPNLREVNPSIIMLSMSGYGATGPDKDYISFGDHLLVGSGMAALTGHPDGPFTRIGIFYGDPVGGMNGAFAVLAALHHRRKTGLGQHIDLGQIEGLTCMIPEAVLDYGMNGRIQPRMGNHDDIMAPHNCYKCKGEDNWVAVAVATDEEWRSLCGAIGRPDLAEDERFADKFQRWANQEEIDRLIGEWTKSHTHHEVTEILQAVEVAATPTLNAKEILEDPHLKARRFFTEIIHPETGRGPVCGLPWQMSETPGKIRGHAPLLGEHNEFVFGELLGMPSAEIAELVEAGVIY